jgi:hypothetical protein
MKTSCLLLAALLTGGLCIGQQSHGTILGRVADPSGAVVPGAKVHAIKVVTNAGASSVTNQDGNFEIPYLLPGMYRVTVELAGFKRVVRENIELRVTDRLAVNFALELGDVADSVVVTAQSPLLESTTASMGTVVPGSVLRDIPMHGGNVLKLSLYTMPGVQWYAGHTTGMGSHNFNAIASTAAAPIRMM